MINLLFKSVYLFIFQEGYNIVSPKYYSSVTFETLQHIFRSDNDVEIPLLKERLRILNETGTCLIEVRRMLISNLMGEEKSKLILIINKN